MASRRQRLSQRRKAAMGLTHESLAQRQGVELSTVVQVCQPENPDTTRALPLDTGVTTSAPSAVQSEVWLGRAEFEDLIRPRVAETVEAVQYTGAGPEDLEEMPLAGRPSRVPLLAQPGSAEPGHPAAVPEPAHTPVPHQPSLTTIPLDVEPANNQRLRGRSQRFTRFAAAGVLALVGGAASVPLITSSPSGPIHPAATGNPAPVAAIPAPDPGTDASPRSPDSIGPVDTAPAVAPTKPAESPAAPTRAAAVPTPHTAWTASRSAPPAATTTRPPPRPPAIPAEAPARSHPDRFSVSDQHRTPPRPEPPPRPRVH
jgi:hypothetical protein